MPPQEPLGRRAELEDVDAFLERMSAGLSTLALSGAAGIGKTTVWNEAVRRGEARGYCVSSAQPSRAERSLSFAGLADLLRPIGAEAFDSLGAVQRHAIDVALLRVEADPQRFDNRAIPAAVLCLLQALAESRPLLVAVDDAQWLDEATAESLAFALRRLERSRVGILVTVRSEVEAPSTFDSVVSPERRREVTLGPLSLAALQNIMKRQLRQSLPRPILVRIVNSCAGNPFYALEIARELERLGVPAAGEPLPVPAELQALVRSRTGRLPRRTREALLVAACLSQPTTRLVGADAIGPAEEAGIVRVERDGRLRFSHPLLAAAVSDSASVARRRAVHGQLAERVGDPEERAWHLALSADGPDEQIARSVDAAAKRAALRGATAAAARLSRRAIELTEDRSSDQATQRVISFAEHCVLAGGDPAETRSALESSLRACDSAELRAELRLWLSFVAREQGRLEEGYEGLLKALEETETRERAARIHLQAIWLAEGDPARGLEHCEAILDLLDESVDPGLVSGAILLKAYFQLIGGHGADDAAVERGRAMEDLAVEQGWRDRSPVPIIWPLLKDDFARAVVVHTEHLEWARQVGEHALELSMAFFLTQLELWLGNRERAESWVATLFEWMEQSGSNRFRKSALCVQGMVDVHGGRLDQAAAAGEEALSIAARTGRAEEVFPLQVLGAVALSRGDLPGVVAHLGSAHEILGIIGQKEPAQHRIHPDLIEALVGLGDLARAEALLAELDDRARIFPRPWILATAARCRGLLLAARGDLEGAAESMRTALSHHEHLEMPLERGRTLLAHGQLLRRRKERRQARAALEEAVSVFEALKTPVWSHRAREELRRIPIRRSQEGLSATEDQVARLAASGLTNREIAARAFLSPKTVEGNLGRVYVKLGVHSRAELVRAMAEREQLSNT